MNRFMEFCRPPDFEFEGMECEDKGDKSYSNCLDIVDNKLHLESNFGSEENISTSVIVKIKEKERVWKSCPIIRTSQIMCNFQSLLLRIKIMWIQKIH